MSTTSIEWTDATWNPVTGCSKVSPGCANRYAETVALRFWPSQYRGIPIIDPNKPPRVSGTPNATRPRAFTDVMTHEDRLEQPLRWRKPRRVFVNSMSDLFHEDVPDAFLDRVFAVMAWTPWHTYQVLTKRAERMRAYFAEPWHRRVFAVYRQMLDDGVAAIAKEHVLQWAQGSAVGAITCGDHNERFLPNVWLGVSVENQHFADERIPLLLQTPAAVRFISAEPLLGPVDLKCGLFGAMARQVLRNHGGDPHAIPRGPLTPPPALDWVIVGGESGPGARPFDIAWARAIVAQCNAADVACFVKQLGAFPVVSNGDREGWARHVGFGTNKRAPSTWREPWPWVPTLRDRKGGDIAEWPLDLRVREFPREARQ